VKYLALITGYQFLLILTGIASGLAFVTSRKRMTASRPPSPEVGRRSGPAQTMIR